MLISTESFESLYSALKFFGSVSKMNAKTLHELLCIQFEFGLRVQESYLNKLFLLFLLILLFSLCLFICKCMLIIYKRCFKFNLLELLSVWSWTLDKFKMLNQRQFKVQHSYKFLLTRELDFSLFKPIFEIVFFDIFKEKEFTQAL